MRVLSLFAGIGGFDLGLERAGMTVVGQCEIDPFCLAVLTKHWPSVWRHDNVCTLTGELVRERCGRIDLICGGFPCQDISSANYRAEGIAGSRSGLWSEFLRIIREVHPKFIIAENVTALAFRGLSVVLSDLAACGFDAEWQTFSASMLGSPHYRERIFIVAYPTGFRCEKDEIFSARPFETTSEKQAMRFRRWPGVRKPSDALPDRFRWCPDSSICGVVDGVPDDLDRYKGLGNAVVPQIVELFGRWIRNAA